MRLSGKQVIERNLTSNTGLPSDFDKMDADGAIRGKGLNVIHAKAYRCPCKERKSTEQTICKNCGGGGWFWANPTLTKMIISGISSKRKYESEGRLDLGSVNVTAFDVDKLSFMDAIVVLDATSEHNEVLFPVMSDDATQLFAMTKYDVRRVDFIGLFEGATSPIKKLEEFGDYSFQDNRLYFGSQYNALEDPSVTIRYCHNPVYHIIDIQRDSMQSITQSGDGEQVIVLPIHATAERAHLIKEAENFAGNRLLDNSWLDMSCNSVEEISSFERKVKYTSPQTIYDMLTSTQKAQLAAIVAADPTLSVAVLTESDDEPVGPVEGDLWIDPN